MSDNGSNGFRDRIVGFGRKPADQFMAHPSNPRRHPQFQRQVVNASLRELGWVAPVVENVRTGNLLDGHERIWQALQNGGEVPFIQVDIAEEEESLFLASFDYMTSLAEYDAEVLDGLLREVQTGDTALQQMLADLAQAHQIPDGGEWTDAFSGLPDSDRAPFQQMTFTLHDIQAEQVKQALGIAETMGDFEDSPNENSNGNALAFICETFLTEHGQR